jgi:tryptophan synthase beta chain
MSQRKYILTENELPKFYYNIISDLPKPLPPVLHPGTKQPIGPADLSPLFPMELILQEVSSDRFIEIPEPIHEAYKIWRPSPLIRALNLERELDTPAKIYYKYEGTSPTGSHKPNTAIPQAFYNKNEGVKKLTTETGAGQWGSALSFAGSMFGLSVEVFMVRVSFEQKPYRKAMMQSYGADVIASPSLKTNSGRKILENDPNNPGSLGIAISEAVEIAASNDDTKYSLGSVLNHVLLHQTIIGNEALMQFEMANDYPDIIIGCVGGGSNFAGLTFPFIGEMLRGGRKIQAIAVEPSACPSLTKGIYTYDFGDTAHLTPLVKMHTLGSTFIPPKIHAGGLRYHGMAPLVSHLKELNLLTVRAEDQIDCFKAGILFAKTEGTLPAPETTHAVKAAIDEALKCKIDGTSKTIAFNLSGHGHFDMQAYEEYLSNNLGIIRFSEEELISALKLLPKVA